MLNINRENRKYVFSIIVPVYNVEEYLAETIESIIGQTYGLENIQVILVNDGSTDGSGKICEDYCNEYPDNILYFEQEHQGVSAARNKGLEYAEGEIINFLDSDDKWDEDAFDKALKKFDELNVNILACRMEFFDAKEGSHPLNYKMETDRVVNILERYDFPQLSGPSTFIKKDIIGNVRFEEEISISEDALFISQLLINELKYGVASDITYRYRKRRDSSSAIGSSKQNRFFYLGTPVFVYKRLFDISIEKYGEVIPYFQYLVMYDLQWRLEQQLPGSVLSEEEKKDYITNIESLIKQIDDTVILEQKHIDDPTKLYVLNIKHGKSIVDQLSFSEEELWMQLNGVNAYNLVKKRNIRTNIIEMNESHLTMEGVYLFSVLEGRCSISVEDNHGNEYKPVLRKYRPIKRYGFNGKEIFDGTAFTFHIPIIDGMSFSYILHVDGNKIRKQNTKLGNFAKIINDSFSYYVSKGHILCKRRNSFYIYRDSFIKHFMFEAKRIIKIITTASKPLRIVLFRLLANAIISLKRKEIWLISDRTLAAGDNGEALFRYINSSNERRKKTNNYFVITEDSPDYTKMKSIGKVIKYNSFLYKLMFLACDKVISSHADKWTKDAFFDDASYVRDMYTFDFIFLQHGIIKDDISKWLFKQNHNMKLFLTTAEREYNSIIEGDYGYDERTVRLLGLPRFDSLQDYTKKIISIMPTWRKNIAGKLLNSSERQYMNDFKKSEYYAFYNKLIGDERIITELRNNGYTGHFYIHPAFSNQAEDFKGNDTIIVHKELADYNKVFRESALLVTDYSSIAFDFSYLKKPVVYTQFDRESFFEGHLYSEGYFSYEEDGFGPIEYNYEDTVQRIISYIETGCKMEDKYQARVTSFFKYVDTNNCERVYKAITEI